MDISELMFYGALMSMSRWAWGRSANKPRQQNVVIDSMLEF